MNKDDQTSVELAHAALTDDAQAIEDPWAADPRRIAAARTREPALAREVLRLTEDNHNLHLSVEKQAGVIAELEVRTIELRKALSYPSDDTTSWESLLMVVKYLRSVSPTADAKALLQRGFDIAREHAIAVELDAGYWGSSTDISWSAAEAELAKEMKK